MSDETENTPKGDDQTSDQAENGASSSQDASSGASAQPSSGGGGTSLSAKPGGVNPQILDAVSQASTAVMDTAASQGAATAYQKVAQATAFAVQDATDYSRNVENIAMTAQGVIVAKMLEDQSNIPIYTPVLATLQEMVIAASTNLTTVGTAAAAIASEYPATKS